MKRRNFNNLSTLYFLPSPNVDIMVIGVLILNVVIPCYLYRTKSSTMIAIILTAFFAADTTVEISFSVAITWACHTIFTQFASMPK
jgi:hypothetical protein